MDMRFSRLTVYAGLDKVAHRNGVPARVCHPVELPLESFFRAAAHQNLILINLIWIRFSLGGLVNFSAQKSDTVIPTATQ
jgi:hypothetical protein